jgi:hypothetical protein
MYTVKLVKLVDDKRKTDLPGTARIFRHHLPLRTVSAPQLCPDGKLG